MKKIQEERMDIIKTRLGISDSEYLSSLYSEAISNQLNKDILSPYIELRANTGLLDSRLESIKKKIYKNTLPPKDWNLCLMYLWISSVLGYSCKIVPSNDKRYHGSVIIDLTKGGE